MIPVGSTLNSDIVQEVQQPSLTWRIDFERGRISGMVDGLDAVKQTVFNIFNTKRFAHLIYSSNFGHEFDYAIGLGPLFMRSEMSRMVKEALSQDDRILSIDDLRIETIGDRALVTCQVVTSLGTFEQRQEVGRIV
ncbi:DUF2634 domain-containing protein [Paenibacillus sp. L3-i20]|uniref:DUF2634 domain-containing protein n=1 Tax=Paenibacillus sp. L3-i20 TaxID=2905833 RepID=UPI001EDF2039|nr:DUF2634 domain-containing protein [Paenibacillus sp. L3-i20]GKU79850.1 hypothetical protein L3i20_v242470 [Paenibacillus sp. L3-i20]